MQVCTYARIRSEAISVRELDTLFIETSESISGGFKEITKL